jgi:hypothetical protein
LAGQGNYEEAVASNMAAMQLNNERPPYDEFGRRLSCVTILYSLGRLHGIHGIPQDAIRNLTLARNLSEIPVVEEPATATEQPMFGKDAVGDTSPQGSLRASNILAQTALSLMQLHVNPNDHSKARLAKVHRTLGPLLPEQLRVPKIKKPLGVTPAITGLPEVLDIQKEAMAMMPPLSQEQVGRLMLSMPLGSVIDWPNRKDL